MLNIAPELRNLPFDSIAPILAKNILNSKANKTNISALLTFH